MLRESITLRQFFESHDMKVPGLSTVADNINAVSAETQQLVLRSELGHAKDAKLDDFDTCRIDSTAANSSSKYPTDSGLLAAFAKRILAYFTVVIKLGLPDLRQRRDAIEAAELAREIELHSKQIGMMSGKQKVKEKRKALYKKIYSRVERFGKKIRPLQQRAADFFAKAEGPPSWRGRVEALNQQLEEDLSNIATIGEYSAERVLEGKAITAIASAIGERCLGGDDQEGWMGHHVWLPAAIGLQRQGAGNSACVAVRKRGRFRSIGNGLGRSVREYANDAVGGDGG